MNFGDYGGFEEGCFAAQMNVIWLQLSKKEGKNFLLGENPNSDGNFVWVHTLMHMFPGGTGKPLSRAALILYRMEWLVETVILTLETFKLSDNL